MERGAIGTVKPGEEGCGGSGAPPPSRDLPVKPHKDRHIVTWTPQEDDLLREQVGIHGTENWTCIAAQLNNKTSRQCRRRWYTYLNAEGKKGGWSAEEDMLLCEAQKIFGNRWTEIAKVVSGRTDNAVKNRFTTLCKKRAKHEALSKENNSSYHIQNDESAMNQNGCITAVPSESSSTFKKIRYQISDLAENHGTNERLLGAPGPEEEHIRPPLAVLVQSFSNVGGLPTRRCSFNNVEAVPENEKIPSIRFQGSFLKRDDPKVFALMQQAELLSSLAQKVHTDNTDQSLEDAWKELKDYLIQMGESGLASSKVADIDFLLDDFKDLLEELSSNTRSQLSVRQPGLHEDSQCSSEYSTGSTQNSNTLTNKKGHWPEECSVNHSTKVHGHLEDGLPTTMDSVRVLSPCEEPKENDGVISALPNTEFGSPLQMIPLFRSVAEGIPSPKFSESERRFLMSALGLSSPSPDPHNSSQQPSCKRAILQSL